MTEERSGLRAEIINAGDALLSGRVSMVMGCRLLTRLVAELDTPDRDLFGAIIAFESETDGYPLGEVRQHYTREYLDRVDREIAEYSERAWPSIVSVCRSIIAVMGSAAPQ